MTRRPQLLKAIALLVLLAGCGNTVGQSPLAELTQGTVQSLRGLRQAPLDVRQFLTPAALAAHGQPLLLIEQAENGTSATLSILGRNGGHLTWVTGDRHSLTLLNGMVASTRGFGDDLVASDLTDSLAALRAGGGQVVRVHSYLDGEDRPITRSFVCTITPAGSEVVDRLSAQVQTRVLDETCRSSSDGFQNRYWIDGAGRILRSTQWISPGFGTLDILAVLD